MDGKFSLECFIIAKRRKAALMDPFLLVNDLSTIIFLPPFLDFTVTSIATVSFFVCINSEILCLRDGFLWLLSELLQSVISSLLSCYFFLLFFHLSALWLNRLICNCNQKRQIVRLSYFSVFSATECHRM